MKVSPQFKEAVRQEIKRQGLRRASEASDRQSVAVKDIQSSRQGLTDARRKLGYAQTELEQWARESGNSTVKAMADKMKSAIKDLDALNSVVEQVHVQVKRIR